MRIAVFGATGRTGRLVVTEAVSAGHEVIGVSRRPPAQSITGVEWRRGDVLAPATVRDALEGAEAVIICLGPGGPGDRSCGQGTQTIVMAARAAGIRRIACQSGAMIGHPSHRLGWVLRAMRSAFRFFQPRQSMDRAVQERAILQSGLAYTLVRPARLTDGPRTEALASDRVRVSSLASTSRIDVAAALVNAVTSDARPRSGRAFTLLSRPALGRRFLARWTGAYAAGELLGLGTVGLTFSIAQGGFAKRLAFALLAGVVEGLLVGGLLGSVLAAFRPELPLRRWMAATVAGAVLGWGLGSLPSLLMGDGGPIGEPPLLWVTAGAFALGAVAGPILAAFQALALRSLAVRPGAWAAANSLGWALAMPLVFLAASSAWTSAGVIFRGATLLALAGSIVGLVTGSVLARSQPSSPSETRVVSLPAGARRAGDRALPAAP